MTRMQALEIKLQEKLGIAPPIIALLSAIPDSALSHAHYALRHPFGAFNLKFRRVGDDLLTCARLTNAFSCPSDFNSLLMGYEKLLSSFATFLEVPNEIILAVCPKKAPPAPKEFFHNWLIRNGYNAGKLFHQAIKSDSVFFSELFNALKHTGNRLRPILGTKADTRVVGYCLENGDREGVISPNQDFHKRYDGKRAANSFSRDLRRLYYLLYKASSQLAICLLQHLKYVHNIELSPDLSRSEDDTSYQNLLQEISALPTFFFPNEAGLTVPYPFLRSLTEETHLVFDIRPATVQLGAWNVTLQTVGDGVSRRFRVSEI